MLEPTPVLFHEDQLNFRPLKEWTRGELIAHPETAERAALILRELRQAPEQFIERAPQTVPRAAIEDMHDPRLLTLYETAAELGPDAIHYPSVFPKLGSPPLNPRTLWHAGGFCFDSGTPLAADTLRAASWSAACAFEAARALREEKIPLLYSLSRPPGHHATRELFGGYCYLNNAALAARELSRHGKVALLDVDFHHGNGSQDIFYRDPRVLVISVHGDPAEHYPYFSGRAEERGAGAGEGFNLNFPLPAGCDGAAYMAALRREVLPLISSFKPDYFVISAGQDTCATDPMGSFTLEDDDFAALGEELGALGYPTVVIQEGGYDIARLGRLVRTFLEGLRRGAHSARRAKGPP